MSALALFAAAVAGSSCAWAADGGYGGTQAGAIGGLPGTDGDAASAHGGDGGPDPTYSGGGGGATNLTTGEGAAGGRRTFGGVLPTGAEGATGVTGATGLAIVNTTISGGIGGVGDTSVGTGGGGGGVTTTGDLTIQATGHLSGGGGGNGGGLNGGGGGGGVGVFSSANVTVDAGGTVAGGAGSKGGAQGGGGGGGAAAILLTGGGTVTNGGILIGGKGGDGGNYSPFSHANGGGGSGAEGVLLTGGGTVINNTGGSISGGAAGGYEASLPLPAPTGGAGIKGANVAVINAGTIAGGSGANAITFTGGVNSLELRAGSVITGNVEAFSASDKFTLGGNNDGSFNAALIGDSAQYRGFGLFEKTGASTWTLTGTTAAVTPWTLTEGALSVASDANLGDASGTLTFNGGTLQVTGTAFTSTTRAINWGVNGGGFDIADPANTFTVSQSLSAGGPLTKTGDGTLTLTGTNTYTGGTTIAAGTLQLGDGGTSGSIVGDVANNAALAFNRSDVLTFGGLISGTGSVDQIGTGTTILTGANSYSGGTTITSGTLQLGDGGTSGSIAGDVVNNATLAFNRSNALTLDGAISGNGTINQIGSGMTTLTGDSSAFSGTANVQSGILSVNGSLGGTMDVLSGGTLQGNGTVGVTTVQTGGVIAPGNSIGTLHVNGPYTQQAGATYQVQLDPTSNTSDLIAINGTATLQPGSLLSASKGNPGNYTPDTIYNVLNATGGVTGTYALAGDTAVSAFLNLVDSYDANNVYLKVVQTRDPGDAAQTPNQTSTAGGIGGTPLENPVLNSPSDAAARDAFDQLSGAGHASVKGAMIYDSRYTRAFAIDRLRDAFCTVGHSSRTDGVVRLGEPAAASGCAANPDRFAVWGQAFGSWGHSNGNGNAARIDRSSGGFVTGIDTSIADSWRVGLLTGYSRSSYSVDAQHASSDSDDYHFGLYGGTQWGRLAVRLGSTYTWHDVTSARSVALPGFFNRLSADYNASTAQVFGELGYQIAAGQFGFEPFANLAYVNLHSNGFVEQGGAAALTSRSSDTGTAFTTLGLRASTDFALGNVKTTARGTLGWLHAYGDITPVSVMSFAGGNSFTVTGVPIATDAAVVEAGLDLHVTREATLGISYGGQFGGSAIDQSVRGNFTMRF